MKVLIAHSRYRSAAPSGENRVVDTEASALTALGHAVVRFERDSDDIAGWSRARQAALPAQVIWNPGVRRDLASVLRAERPDVVHVHNTFPMLSAAVLYACRDVGVPVVATIHNYKLTCASGDFFRAGAVCHDCAGRAPLPALRHACYRGSRAATVPVALTLAAHRQAWRKLVAAYILLSGPQRDLLSRSGLAPDRVFVRPNLIPASVAAQPVAAQSVAAQPVAARSAAARSAAGASSRPEWPLEAPPEVMYAGRLDEAKGIRVLMAGWDRFRAQTPSPLRLVIAGSGPLEAEVTAWAAARPSVRLAGRLDPDECARAMSRARAVLLPSAWEETFGLAAVEAMALGTAPIAAGHGSFPELVTHGVDGVLFRPGDPGDLARVLADAAADPARFAEYGAMARKTYERRFDPAEIMRQLIGIYEFAISNPVGTAPGRSSARSPGPVTS